MKEMKHINKQKDMIMENKHLNQMIDQTKINYYKEM